MNPLLAFGLFDSPWVVAAIVLGSMVANWLSKRRQEKEAERQSRENRPPSTSPGKPAQDFDLEETLRRLMGEEPPPKPPAPPPVPRPVRRELPPEPTWVREMPTRPPRPTPSPIRPPALPVAQPLATDISMGEAEQDAAIRIAQLSEQARRAVAATTRKHSPRSPTHWRNPRTVREAFVASLVFAPPKGLES